MGASDGPVTVAATFCATLVDEWLRAGVTDAVVSPGSRSTPLVLALAGDGRLALHVHHDERAAGFVALGLGLATGRPALVVTTSGTAAVELHPAVVEAHHAGVPLVACTADRPPELLDVGAPQTVDQHRLYGGAVRWFAAPGAPDAAARASWRSLAARAVAESTSSPPGPVHLDLAFRDPLVGEPGPLPEGRPDGRPWHRRRPAALASRADAADVAALLDGRRGVIVAGAGVAGPQVDELPAGAGPEAGGSAAAGAVDVHRLAERLGWPVLADPRSGCRTPEPTTVAHADALLRHADFAGAHRPEVVLRLGLPLASKVVSQWLSEAANRGATQVLVEPSGRWLDPERTADVILAGDPAATCRALVAALDRDGSGAPPSWLESWATAELAAAAAIEAALAAHPEPTEPAVARATVAAVPDGATLMVASSMPVRDVEWYAEPRQGLRVLSNRGANGIDGVVSTAVGVALGGAPTAVLVGDIAFLHDSNALLGATGRGTDLTIVCVDNDGGGIFSFLPQAAAMPAERFERLFGTPHGVDLAALAAVHGVPTERPATAAEVGSSVARAMAAGGVRLVLVRTDRTANVAVHEELHDAVASFLSTPDGDPPDVWVL